MRRRDYGAWGKPIPLFEAYLDWKEAQESLQEGTGAPEGRADFATYMQTVIRNKVRDGWETVPSRWREFVSIESLQDLRPESITEFGFMSGIGSVNELGEYPRMKTSEAGGPEIAVAKFGGIYSISMETILNDQLSKILGSIPTKIGEAAGDYLTETVIAFIESNPDALDGDPFFSVSRGNEATGGSATPNETNLATILSTMKLRRIDNKPVRITPTKVLVRDDITKLIFRRIINSQVTQFVGGSGATFDKGNINPLEGILPNDAIIDDPWLNDPNDYYIFADVKQRPAFHVGFLQGREEPFIGLKDPGVKAALGSGSDPYDFEIDSIDFKTRHFSGTAAGEPFAAYRGRP